MRSDTINDCESLILLSRMSDGPGARVTNALIKNVSEKFAKLNTDF